MKNINKQTFEGNWRETFGGAEVEPSASVWANIELDLARVESSTMRRQVLYYKWLAAASVVLVLFLGGAFYFGSKYGDGQISTTATKSTGLAGKKGDSRVAENKSNETTKERNKADGTGTAIEERNTSNKSEADSGLAGNQSMEASPLNLDAGEETETQIMLATSHKTVSARQHEAVTLASIVEDVPAVVKGKVELPRLVLPAMPASFMASARNDQKQEDVWASVGVAAGSYNPSYSGGGRAYTATSPQAGYSNSSGYSDASNTGSSYSAGFAMSKRVFSKWVLQSGVNYINQNIGYTSNYLTTSPSNQSKAFVAEYADFLSQSVTITTPYQINSVVEVLSLPLQTGYLLVDRKIGWQLNTGIATDIFIRNTLTDQSGNASRFTQGTGENSPYRAVSWSGLLGTEVSYKVARQSRFSVVPSMRYSVNSVMKSSSGVSSNPLVMDIGFRFRYIFK